jgi:TonB family protein
VFFSDSESQIDKPPSLQGSQSMEPPAIKSGQLIKSTGPMVIGSEPPKIPDTRREPDEKPPAVSEIASSSQRKLDAYPDYRAVGLDPQPYPLHEINPVYPQHAGSLEGSVVLRLLINERGIVDDAVVVSSFPKDVFDESAVMAFRSALFSPGMFLGMPVKSQLTIEVEFLPTNRGAGVSGRGY